MIAALLALSWQTFVAQTHVHYAPPAYSQASTASTSTMQSGNQRSPDTPSNCPICQELATAGHYLQPSPPGIELRISGEVWLSLAPLSELALREASHFWRSRAPPQQLQA